MRWSEENKLRKSRRRTPKETRKYIEERIRIQQDELEKKLKRQKILKRLDETKTNLEKELIEELMKNLFELIEEVPTVTTGRQRRDIILDYLVWKAKDAKKEDEETREDKKELARCMQNLLGD